MLEVHGLCKGYQSGGLVQTVLDDLTLTVKQGEVVALVGASGSGKTTLLNLLSGIDTPDAGQVLIEQVNLSVLSDNQRTLVRRHKLGFVFQFFNLIPTLTVAENIALPMQLIGTPATEINATTQQLLDKVGLNDMHKRYPETLSGGEQQRVAIARAIAHRPALLLADEPTGNLDEETGEHIITLLNTLAKAHQIAMLLVTHSHRVAASADSVLTLQHGRLS